MTRTPVPMRLAALVLWAMAGRGVASELKIIANPGVKISAISLKELRGIFLETRTLLADGSRVEPVLLRSGLVHEQFARQIIGKTDAALETYYRSLVFTGKGLIPKRVGSDAEVIDYVVRTKGAIGYIGVGTDAGKAKTMELVTTPD